MNILTESFRDLKARFGIWMKVTGCLLIHGREPVSRKPRHVWGEWRPWTGQDDLRACMSCGTYEHRPAKEDTE